jgi:hypothetical protein
MVEKEQSQQRNPLQLNTEQANSTAKNLDNWSEVRLSRANPERRSYHSSFTYNKFLYILGGLDIREGSMSSLWQLDL